MAEHWELFSIIFHSGEFLPTCFLLLYLVYSATVHQNISDVWKATVLYIKKKKKTLQRKRKKNTEDLTLAIDS